MRRLRSLRTTLSSYRGLSAYHHGNSKWRSSDFSAKCVASPRTRRGEMPIVVLFPLQAEAKMINCWLKNAANRSDQSLGITLWIMDDEGETASSTAAMMFRDSSLPSIPGWFNSFYTLLTCAYLADCWNFDWTFQRTVGMREIMWRALEKIFSSWPSMPSPSSPLAPSLVFWHQLRRTRFQIRHLSKRRGLEKVRKFFLLQSFYLLSVLFVCE